MLENVPVVLDLGNWGLKGTMGDNPRKRIAVPHGLREMDFNQWQSIVEANGNRHTDYIIVDNRYYEVGELALRHSASVYEGTKRYTRKYYGALMCYVMAMLLQPEEIKSAIVFASFPPGDRMHKKALEQALLGMWFFNHLGRDYQVEVKRVITYAEPLGGFWNWLFQYDEEGNHIDNPEYLSHRQTLVVDFGGGTISQMPIGTNQKPDFVVGDSVPYGFNKVAASFAKNLKGAYPQLFMNTRNIPSDLLHEALRCGYFRGGGNEDGMDVREIVDQTLGEMLADFSRVYQSVGGPIPYGQIILSGGGCGTLGERLKIILDHKRVFYACDPSELIFSTMNGGVKVYEEMKAWDRL